MSSTISAKPSILRTFKVPISDDGRTRDIHITEPPHIKADNLNLETWASSQVLAGVLHKLNLSESISDATLPDASIPILELGAGTALVGITACSLTHASTILTDLPGIVPGIAANIDVNKDLLGDVPVKAGSLDWRQPEFIECADGTRVPASRKARVLFAADTVYDEDHPELLERVVVRWLERDSKSKFIICYPMRVAYMDHIRDLWSRFEEAGLTATDEGRATGDATNGDDEMLCEWVVWQWNEEALSM